MQPHLHPPARAPLARGHLRDRLLSPEHDDARRVRSRRAPRVRRAHGDDRVERRNAVVSHRRRLAHRDRGRYERRCDLVFVGPDAQDAPRARV
eukprot:31176-Pelagococcus_subviridis.AAC.63